MSKLSEYDLAIGVPLLCGVDEAGRGPLAGDVYAAAVILPEGVCPEGLNDSKKLTPQKRDRLYDEICEIAVDYSVAKATVEEIERLNILGATMLAMARAVEGLAIRPQLVLVDGNRSPSLPVHSRTVVKGDATSACIAAASILAKVSRDRSMDELEARYPGYGFAKHKGYGTALHYEKLDELGPCPAHRPSFLKSWQEKKNPWPTFGQQAEMTAAGYLEKLGYTVVAQNYHCTYGELDLVATKGDTVAFIEVKARNIRSIAPPETAVDGKKQHKLSCAAACWLQETGCKLIPRFDVIALTYRGKPPRLERIEHYENAFFSTL